MQPPECSGTTAESVSNATEATSTTTAASSAKTEVDPPLAPNRPLPWLICRLQQVQSQRSKTSPRTQPETSDT
ncbi:MAG: hypothetical protein CMM07_09475 [Rhodopirellula sp.]|nr:hypothetical protein [Rhodopirellula sp.]